MLSCATKTSDEDPILESAERLRVALLVLHDRLAETQANLPDLDALEQTSSPSSPTSSMA